MTKQDIVTAIYKQTGIDRNTTLTVVESFMEQVKAALAQEDNVYLRGFAEHHSDYPRAQHSRFQACQDFLPDRQVIPTDKTSLKPYCNIYFLFTYN